MSPKEPIIRFSPFEALFIGEKNRILKRQPTKNTIFVTRLNQRSKNINLRDLFDLEESKKTKYNDVIFKMPQRVCDFLRHKRLQNITYQSTDNKESESLLYNFKGHKIKNMNNKTLLTKTENMNVKPVEVKFKRKFKCKGNIHNKVVKKFAGGCKTECKSLNLKNIDKNSNKKRHFLRGKDGKFICKKDYEKLKFKEVSPKQKYLSNYLHHLYLKRNKELFNNGGFSRNKNTPELEMPYSIEAVVGLPNSQFDITASETTLNKISEKYYENNCHEDFRFPNFPNQLEPLDFDYDSYLIDLIYENFPKIIQFYSQSHCSDFSEALLDCNILKHEKNVKMYEKKNNGLVKDEEIREILNRRFPIIKLKRINNIMPNHCLVKNKKNLFAAKIDEPNTKKSNLIMEKSFGSFFFRSAEEKDIFIGNLMKPFLENSWFGSLPES